jgi:hypothetical protein
MFFAPLLRRSAKNTGYAGEPRSKNASYAQLGEQKDGLAKENQSD